MAKRKRVALIYAYNENWIGGTYYIENLIAALGQLPDAQQPHLLIFTTEVTDIARLKQATHYNHWSFRQFERTLSLPARIVNKLSSIVIGKRLISLLHGDIDLVFPVPTGWQHYFSRTPHHLYWIPDFQEHYLPAFFKAEEIEVRKAGQQLVLALAQHIVFSSYAAQQDFNTIYPANKLVQHILQFAVTSPSGATSPEIAACLAQYGIAKSYFICSNQFWKHKNHPIVLQAIAQLVHNHPDVLVVFTGKEHDYRNPTYFEELMALKHDLGLHHEIIFLGFIPRKDQLILMQAASAVIQPSLFEGWSTVVEDAKSLNVPLLISDLIVHKEQLDSYDAKLFFSPTSASELSECMTQVLKGNLPAKSYPYQLDVARFAQVFMKIVQQITYN